MIVFPRRAARAHLAQLGRFYSVHDPASLEAFAENAAAHIGQASGSDLRAAIELDEKPAREGIMVVKGSVAHIPIDGFIMNRGGGFFRYWGLAATGINEIRHALQRALDRDDVDSIMLEVNSPGGSVLGLRAAADDLFEANKVKTVHAHAHGLVASAAYFMASQADRFTADAGTIVGSIGTINAILDASKAAEKDGIKVHVVRSHELKAPGMFFGEEVTEAQVAELQREVDDLTADFRRAVARGRGMEAKAVADVATGQTWLAEDAKGLGLIDAVGTLKSAVAAFQEDAAGTSSQEGQMSKDSSNQGTLDVSALMAQVQETVTASITSALEPVNQKLTAMEASIEDAKVSAEAAKASQKTQMIDQAIASGRVLPAQRDMIEALASACTPEQLAEHLKGFKASQEHANPSGAPGPQEPEAALSNEDKAVAQLFGLDAKQMKAAGEVVAISIDGKAHLADGTEKSIEEVV